MTSLHLAIRAHSSNGVLRCPADSKVPRLRDHKISRGWAAETGDPGARHVQKCMPQPKHHGAQRRAAVSGAPYGTGRHQRQDMCALRMLVLIMLLPHSLHVQPVRRVWEAKAWPAAAASAHHSDGPQSNIA